MDAQWPRFLSTLATRARPSIQEGAKALTSALLSQIHSGLRVCTSLDWVCTGVGYDWKLAGLNLTLEELNLSIMWAMSNLSIH